MVSMSSKVLVSFQHNIAAVIDGRILSIWACVCEEMFHGEAAITPKEEHKPPTKDEAFNKAQSMTLDFPIMLRVLSLADGKPLDRQIEVMVKWSNISAMCNFEDSWIKHEDNIVAPKPTKSKRDRG